MPALWLKMFLFGMVLCLPQAAFAHGTEGTVRQGGWVIQARYAGGEPMSFAKVTVTAPQADKPFQTGRTDQNGCFAFVPDVPGQWRLVADDEMGHRLTLTVEVPAASLASSSALPPGPSQSSTSLASRALLGVSLLLLAASLALWWQAKKLRQAK